MDEVAGAAAAVARGGHTFISRGRALPEGNTVLEKLAEDSVFIA